MIIITRNGLFCVIAVINVFLLLLLFLFFIITATNRYNLSPLPSLFIHSTLVSVSVSGSFVNLFRLSRSHPMGLGIEGGEG